MESELHGRQVPFKACITTIYLLNLKQVAMMSGFLFSHKFAIKMCFGNYIITKTEYLLITSMIHY